MRRGSALPTTRIPHGQTNSGRTPDLTPARVYDSDKPPCQHEGCERRAFDHGFSFCWDHIENEPD